MPNPNRHGSHTITRFTAHLVWVTKYRYHVLTDDVQMRCRELLIQICNAEDIIILKGAVSMDHVHMHIEYPPRISISDIMKSFKGRTSHHLQDEFPLLKKRYWGRHFWAIGYGAWSTGNVTEDMIQKYIAGHKDSPNDKALMLG
jgi:putative transposase